MLSTVDLDSFLIGLASLTASEYCFLRASGKKGERFKNMSNERSNSVTECCEQLIYLK